jgi:hypothetical protein
MNGSSASADCVRRVVVIGASNLALGLPEVLEAARCHWGQPLDVLASIGHGRSYGLQSRVLWRELPAILQCELWPELQSRDPAPTAALITDIGNDIVYGASLAMIARWVEACLRQLSELAERTIVTALPMESLERVGKLRFHLMRAILFPRSTLNWKTALERARAVNEAVRSLALSHNACFVHPQREWYGLDPIHIRRGKRASAWGSILSNWQGAHSVSCARLTMRDRMSLRRARPRERFMFGKLQRHEQPTVVLADGTTISLY